MRKMREPSANDYELEKDVNENLRNEVARICKDNTTALATESESEGSAPETEENAAEAPEPPRKKKKKKRAGDIIYKIFIIIMIVVCIAIVCLCVRLIIGSMDTEVKYVYHYNGTTGYEAPEGMTIDLTGETEEPISESAEETPETEGETDAGSGAESSGGAQGETDTSEPQAAAELEDGLYFDSADE